MSHSQTRTALVAQLLADQQKQRRKTPILSLGQGFAGLGSDLLTAIAQKKATTEQKEFSDADKKALQFALTGRKDFFDPDDTSTLLTPGTAPGSPETLAIAAGLAGTPEAAQNITGLGLQQQFAQQAEQRRQKNALELQQAKRVTPKGGNLKVFRNTKDQSTMLLDLNNPKDVEFARANSGVLVPIEQKTETGGPGSFSDLTKPVNTFLQKELITNRARLDRVDLIAQGFKPEFLQIGTRVGAVFDALQEKLNLGELNDKEKSSLSALSKFKRDAVDNLAQILKEMSGAAINPSEAERLKLTLPDPGTGVFDGDSPTVFKAKLDGVIRNLNRSQARLSFALGQGIDFSSIPLESIDAIIEARQRELEETGLSRSEVESRLKKEFGL